MEHERRQAADCAAARGPDPVAALAALLAGRRVVALTGAGCSTESGIPDYRGPGLDGRPRPPRRPIELGEFLASEAARRRYWARAVLGWPAVARARPNPAHRALAALERRGVLAGLITQNVDRLHGAAGSREVVELHGALARVRCVACDATGDRAELQERLIAANPHLAARSALAAPDGDAELDGELVARTTVVPCDRCGGPLRPDVVFFGDCVPAPVLARAWQVFDRAEVLLVVGSSLSLHSGYRFVRRAAERGVPVAIVNLGPTRGDREAAIKVEGRAGEVLPALCRLLP